MILSPTLQVTLWGSTEASFTPIWTAFFGTCGLPRKRHTRRRIDSYIGILQTSYHHHYLVITCWFCLFVPALGITHKIQKDNNNKDDDNNNNNKSFGGAFSPLFFPKGSPTRHPSLGNQESNIMTHRIYVWYIHPCKCPERVPWAPPTGTSIKA